MASLKTGSQYTAWDNNLSKDYSTTTKSVLTQRLSEMTQPKSLQKDYMSDRPSQIWSIKPSVLKNTPSARICSLLRAKTTHLMYKPPKGVKTSIPLAALRATSSARVHQLSRHKTSHPYSSWSTASGTGESGQVPSLKGHFTPRTASSRIEELSTPK